MLVSFQRADGVNPEINALATLILGAVGIVGFIARYLMARAENSGYAISSVQDMAEDTKICQPGYIMPRMPRHCFSHGRRNVGIF